MGESLEQTFCRMSNNHTKRCSASLECELKPQWNALWPPAWSIWEDWWWPVSGGVNTRSSQTWLVGENGHFSKFQFGSSYKVRHMLTMYPSGPLLGIFSWEMKSYVHTRLEPQCPVDLFIVASNRPSLSAGEWMNTLGQSYGEMLIAAKGAKGSSCRMYNSQKHVKWKVRHKGNIWDCLCVKPWERQNYSDRQQISNCLGLGWEGHRRAIWGDGNIFHDCGGGHTNVYICQNLVNCVLKIDRFSYM